MAHASPIELVVDDELLYKKFNRFGSLIPMMLHVAMLDSMREVFRRCQNICCTHLDHMMENSECGQRN